MNSRKISKIIEYINQNRNISKKQIFSRLKRKLYTLWLNRLSTKNNAFIPASAHIGKNVVFPHGIGGDIYQPRCLY